MVDLPIYIVLLALVTIPSWSWLLTALVGLLSRTFVSKMSHLIANIARSSAILV